MKEKATNKKETAVNLKVDQKSVFSVAPTVNLDETDRQILQILQDNFPVTQEPWLEISRRLSISQDEVLLRLKRLKETGAILKIAPILDSKASGLKAATLVAMRVPKSRVNEVAAVINTHDVSHNYERDDEYNVWFTLAAPTGKELVAALDDIKKKTGVSEHDTLDLPAVQRFKINVHFQLTKTMP